MVYWVIYWHRALFKYLFEVIVLAHPFSEDFEWISLPEIRPSSFLKIIENFEGLVPFLFSLNLSADFIHGFVMFFISPIQVMVSDYALLHRLCSENSPELLWLFLCSWGWYSPLKQMTAASVTQYQFKKPPFSYNSLEDGRAVEQAAQRGCAGSIHPLRAANPAQPGLTPQLPCGEQVLPPFCRCIPACRIPQPFPGCLFSNWFVFILI